jgi:hypothetical protein
MSIRTLDRENDGILLSIIGSLSLSYLASDPDAVEETGSNHSSPRTPPTIGIEKPITVEDMIETLNGSFLTGPSGHRLAHSAPPIRRPDAHAQVLAPAAPCSRAD